MQVGLEQQRRLAALFEPVDRGARDASASSGTSARGARCPAAPALPSRRHCSWPSRVKLPVEEPAQQRRALAVAKLLGVGGHRVLQRRPVGDRGADIGESALQRRRPARAGRARRRAPSRYRSSIRGMPSSPTLLSEPSASRVTRNDRVDDAVDRRCRARAIAAAIESTRKGMSSLTIASRIRRRGSVAGSASSAIAGGARRPGLGGGGDEGRGFRALGLSETLQFPRKCAFGQPGGECVRQRFKRGLCHAQPYAPVEFRSQGLWQVR